MRRSALARDALRESAGNCSLRLSSSPSSPSRRFFFVFVGASFRVSRRANTRFLLRGSLFFSGYRRGGNTPQYNCRRQKHSVGTIGGDDFIGGCDVETNK